MKSSWVGGLALILGLAGVAACTGSDDDADDDTSSSSSGSTGDGGSGGASSSSGGSSGSAAACTTPGRTIFANEPKELSNLSVVGDTAFFISATLGLGAAAPSLESVKTDGTGRTVLYTPAGDRRLVQARATAERIVFLERDNAATEPAEEIWTMPLTGGTPTRVGTATFPEARIFAIDATYVYFSRIISGVPGTAFDRVAFGTGTADRIANSVNGGVSQARLSGTTILFQEGGMAGGTTTFDFMRIDSTLLAQTPTKIGTVESLCDNKLGAVQLTPTKLACGFSGVTTSAFDGTSVQAIIPKDLTLPATHFVVASDVENLYVMNTQEGGENQHLAFRRVSSVGGDIVPIACDGKSPANKLLNVVFPNPLEYEVTTSATELLWIEKSGQTAPVTWSLRAAAK